MCFLLRRALLHVQGREEGAGAGGARALSGRSEADPAAHPRVEALRRRGRAAGAVRSRTCGRRAGKAMCSLPCHAASMRSSARRSVAASTWLRAEMPNTMWSQRQTPSFSIAASETFGYQPGPTYGHRLRQDCLALRAALHKAQVRQHAVHGLNAIRRAQDGQGEGGVGQPVAPAAHHVHADVRAVLCARLRLKNQREQLGAPDELHNARGHAALQTRGLRALSQRLLAVAVAAQRLQSLHAARKGLPHRHHVVQRRRPSPQPHSAHLPFCAARVFCLSAAPGTLEQLQKNLVRQAGQALAPVLLPQCLAPPQHLVLLRQLLDPVPRLSLSPQYCAGLLMATLGLLSSA